MFSKDAQTDFHDFGPVLFWGVSKYALRTQLELYQLS
jgi:hypothetical protein